MNSNESKEPPTKPATGFTNWTRSAAMWIIWNIPCGRLAPWVMAYAMNSDPRKSE